MVGWKGYEFSPTNFNHSISCTSMKMPKAPGSQTHPLRAEKNMGAFQVHLDDFEWWKSITKNFVEHFLSDLVLAVQDGLPKISKTVDGWEILQNVVYPAIYNEFCTSPRKCCFARLLINMTQGFSIRSQVVNAVAVTTQGPQTMQMSFRPSARWASRKVLVPDGFSGWNDPRFGRFFWNPFLETCEMWALSHFVKPPDHKCLLSFWSSNHLRTL